MQLQGGGTWYASSDACHGFWSSTLPPATPVPQGVRFRTDSAEAVGGMHAELMPPLPSGANPLGAHATLEGSAFYGSSGCSGVAKGSASSSAHAEFPRSLRARQDTSPTSFEDAALGGGWPTASGPECNGPENVFEEEGPLQWGQDGDVWFSLGHPAVRVEPLWERNGWWSAVPVDLRGLEKRALMPSARVDAVEHLLEQAQDQGTMPLLPVPHAWRKAESCPIS